MALHTDIPTRAEIERLLDAASPHCVSIYLPTHRVTQETAKDRLVLRDLARPGHRASARRRGRRATTSPTSSSTCCTWSTTTSSGSDQADSLAIFASPNRFETHRLPNHLTASVQVSDRFHITPLLRSVSFPHAAWILAISQGSVRLLEIGPSGPPQEVHVPGMPKDAWESSGNKIHRAREAAYARKVDTALREVITGSDLPLILAASQPMAALFRSVSTYPHLVAEREHGSPDTTSDADLADGGSRHPRRRLRRRSSPSWRSGSTNAVPRAAPRSTCPTSLAWPPSVRSTRCWSTSTGRCPARSTRPAP